MGNIPNTEPSRLGTHLRHLRNTRGWTRKTLSERAGVSPGTIANIELYAQTPSLGVLSSLAAAFEVPMSSLLEEAQ